MTIVKQLLYVYIWLDEEYVYQQRQMIACEIQESSHVVAMDTVVSLPIT